MCVYKCESIYNDNLLGPSLNPMFFNLNQNTNMKKKRSARGFSTLLSIGSYGGFHFIFSPFKLSSIRLCLGWIALTIYFYDLETAIEHILENQKK